MDGKTLARIGAIILIAVAITTTAIEMNRKDDRQDAFTTQARPFVPPNPLDAELLRCSQIGEAGTRDSGCLKAWTESRRRFLGQGPAPSAVPAAPENPITKDSAPTDQTQPAVQIEPARPEVR